MLKKIWHVFLACFLIFVSVSGVLAFPLSVSAATSSTINICIVDYSGHVDTSPNADMTAILAADPNILIDNTAYSLWELMETSLVLLIVFLLNIRRQVFRYFLI